MHALEQNSLSLPGGLAIGGDSVLTRAELRPLTGREEDWLARHPSVPSAIVVSRLLGSCLVSLQGQPADAAMVRQLLVGDRDFLMLRLREMTLGETMQAVVLCQACGEKMDVAFRADAVPVEVPGSPVQPNYALTLGDGAAAREVRFRLPTGGDQEAVVGLSPEAGRARLLELCVLSDGGGPLDAAEADAVEDAIERAAPRLDLDLDLECPYCAAVFVLPFDTTSFFLQEMRAGRRTLLREFHSLAFHYHWSEPAIMALDRRRRRAYLSLLTDELRRP